MRIIGTVSSSKSRDPIMGAKIELRIDHHENFVILTDRQGRFKYEVEGKYGILNLTVKKEGFREKSFSYRIDKPELPINIFLDEIPGQPEMEEPVIEEPVMEEPVMEEPVEEETEIPGPIVFVEEQEIKPHKKKWYEQVKDFLSTNSSNVARFLIDQITEHRKKWGKNEEIESYKQRIEVYKEKTEFFQKELDEYGETIKELETMLGDRYISENAFVNWNLDNIKPKKPAFNIDVWVEKGDYRGTRDILRVKKQKPDEKYKIGDKINLYFKSEKDCYLFLLNHGTSGKLTVLFPNSLHEDNFIKGNRVYAIPGEEYPFDYILSGPPGTEKVKAIASTRKFKLIDLTYKKGQVFSTSASATRDISIAAKKTESDEFKDWAEAACEIEVA